MLLIHPWRTARRREWSTRGLTKRGVFVVISIAALLGACIGHGYPEEPHFPPAPGYPAQPSSAPLRPVPRQSSPEMSVPGVSAPACTDDGACGLARCNTLPGTDGHPYNKCAFPCASNKSDCVPGATCNDGFCVPVPPSGG